jgi:hypothetical protein
MSLAPIIGQLGVGIAANVATSAVSGLARNIPLVGGLVSGIANGIGSVATGLLPGLFK